MMMGLLSFEILLLLNDFIDTISYNNFLIESTSDNKIIKPETVLLCFVMNTLILLFRTAYCDCLVSFPHSITLLDNIRRLAVKGFGFSRSEGAGGMPCAMLALKRELSRSPTFFCIIQAFRLRHHPPTNVPRSPVCRPVSISDKLSHRNTEGTNRSQNTQRQCGRFDEVTVTRSRFTVTLFGVTGTRFAAATALKQRRFDILWISGAGRLYDLHPQDFTVTRWDSCFADHLTELRTSIASQHRFHLRLLLFRFGRFTKRPTAYRTHKVSDAEHFLHVPIACDGFITLGLWLNVSIHFWLSSPTALAKCRSESILFARSFEVLADFSSGWYGSPPHHQK